MNTPTPRIKSGSFEFEIIGTWPDKDAHAAVSCYDKPATLTDLAEIPTYIFYDDCRYAVTEIGPHAFYGAAIKHVHIPFTVKVIRKQAFKTSTVEEISGCACVEVIEAEAFSDCKMLKEYPFTERLLHINEQAFANVSQTNFHLPASLRTMDILSFFKRHGSSFITLHGSTRLTTTVPEGDLFPDTYGEQVFTVLEPFTEMELINGALLSADKRTLFMLNPGPSEYSVTIPGSVEHVFNLSFLKSTDVELVFEKSEQKLHVAMADNVTPWRIEVHRPIKFKVFGWRTSECPMQCFAPTEVEMEDRAHYSVVCHPGGSIRFSDPLGDINGITEEIEYRGSHPYVETIYPGRTLLAPDTKEIGSVVPFQENSEALNWSDNEIIMRSATPPNITNLERGALKGYALLVPEGSSKAFSSHPQWKKAAKITEYLGDTIDFEAHKKTSHKKDEMMSAISDRMASSLAKKFFGDRCKVTSLIDTALINIHAKLSDGKKINLNRLITSADAAKVTTWEAMSKEIEQILRFIDGESYEG